MRDNIMFFLSADLFSTMTYFILQGMPVDVFVVDNSMKVFAAIFVGFLGGFMGVVGKKVGEDYLRSRKNKKDAAKD